MTTLEINEIIRNGSPNDLGLVLDELQDINAVYCAWNGHTVLHDAVLTGEVEKVKLILARKPQLEIRSQNQKFTPLHTAVVNDHVAVIEALLDAGASIEATATDGLTSIHLAAMRGHRRATEMLLQRGANVHATEANGATALHGAAFYGHTDVVRSLLGKGADADRPDRNGLTPRGLARQKGHSTLLRLMDEKPAVPIQTLSDPCQRNLIRISIYEMNADFLRTQRVRALFTACRPAHGPIHLVDFKFKNGVELLNVPIQDEHLVTIPSDYASMPVETASIPVRERQRTLAPMTAKRCDGSIIF